MQKRHCLPLHIRTHQGSVSIVILKKRNQVCGHANELFGTDVYIPDFFNWSEHKVPFISSTDTIWDDAVLIIYHHVGLGYMVFITLPSSQIESVRTILSLRFLTLCTGIGFFYLNQRIGFAYLEICRPRFQDLDIIDDPTFLDSSIRRFNKTVLVNLSIATQ